MPPWTSAELAKSVLTTMQDVLVHQRARWASLLGHQHQREGWWQAEFALALESWCFRLDLPEPMRVRSEAKPEAHGVKGGKGRIDLLVARWSDETKKILHEAPRVWIELKERGTWWEGGPGKALCEAGRSLWSDLHKWKEAAWLSGDVVVACQIISHDAKVGSAEPLPLPWKEVLDKIHAEFPRFLDPRSVVSPAICPSTGEAVYRFTTIEFFTIKGSNDGE